MWLVVVGSALLSTAIALVLLVVLVWESPWLLLAFMAIPLWIWRTHRQIERELAEEFGRRRTRGPHR